MNNFKFIVTITRDPEVGIDDRETAKNLIEEALRQAMLDGLYRVEPLEETSK